MVSATAHVALQTFRYRFIHPGTINNISFYDASPAIGKS